MNESNLQQEAAFQDWLTPTVDEQPQPVETPDVEVVPDPLRTWFVADVPVINAAARSDVKYFVNGKDYCADLYRELSRAQQHIYLTGLHFMHDFGLIRSSSGNRTLAQTLMAKAEAGVRIYLIVNLLWPSERRMIGQWNTNGEFRYYNTPRTRDSFSQPSRRKSELNRTIRELIIAWPHRDPATRLLNAFIGANGFIDRYFPATLDLFRALAHTNIKCRLDIHPGFIMHTHHQKTVVVDDRVSYVGGIDLTHVDGDRWDTSAHTGTYRKTNRAEKYWHDIHGRLDGVAAGVVAENFKDRWRNGNFLYIPTTSLSGTRRSVQLVRDSANGREFGPAPRRVRPGPHSQYSLSNIRSFTRPKIQLVRSMPALPNRRGYSVPRGRWERTAKDAYLTGIHAGKQLIYLENQWIADEHIWTELTLGASANQRPDYQIVLMMPNEPLRAAGAGANQDIFTELNLLKLLRAAHSSKTVSVFSLVKPNTNQQIYVHSKIMTVDDVWSLIGSANAGGISLEGIRDFPTFLRIVRQFANTRRISLRQIFKVWKFFAAQGNRPDTELSFITLDPAFANNLRTSIWREHLAGSSRSLTGRIDADVDTLRAVANLGRYRLRNHPYLITAFKTGSFPGIDLRIFAYDSSEFIQRIRRRNIRFLPGTIGHILGEIQKLPQLINTIQLELSSYQPSIRHMYFRQFASTIGPFLTWVMRASPSNALAIRRIMSQIEQLAGQGQAPNV